MCSTARSTMASSPRWGCRCGSPPRSLSPSRSACVLTHGRSEDEMNLTEMLRAGRVGMIEIGRSLSDDEAETIVPGCPEWTIRQVYAHQAGVVADALAGRLDGVATDPWTARQVEERANTPLAVILDEWEAAAPQFEDVLVEGGPREVIFDQWTHEQDIRAALDRPGNRDDERAAFCADSLASGMSRSWKHEPFTIVTDSRTWQVGDG